MKLTAAPATVTVTRALAERALSALRSAMTPAAHLAQRVTHERLGYCAWNAESERCAEQRALIAELSAALATTSHAPVMPKQEPSFEEDA